jgi:putative AbiEi antitoxin of type IV toxin-antitoxin system
MSEHELVDPRLTRIMLRGELIDAGWSDRGIARMVKEGIWVKIRRGAYAVRKDWRRLDKAGQHVVRTRAVMRQANTEVVASHVSGLMFYDGPTWGLDLDPVHVTRTDRRAGRAEAGVRQHRGRILEGDVAHRLGTAVMAAPRLGLEVTTVADTEAALVAVNHLLHTRATTLEQMRSRYELGIDCWAHTLSTDVVLRLADPRIESPGESRVLYLCYLYGLPAPEPQYAVRDRSGKVVARVDFAWPELGLFLEFDGVIKYEKLLDGGESPSDVVVREKRREDLVRELTGWRCLRLVWADLDRPDRTASRIRDKLFQTPVLAR